MIDYKKVNNYLLDLLIKGNKVYYGEHEDKIVLSDSYALWILDKDKVFINLQLCNFIPEFYNKYIPDDYNYLHTSLTDTIELNKKDTLRILVNENMNIRINEKYLKFIKDVEFKSLSDDKPILCYINDNIIGLILPVKTY